MTELQRPTLVYADNKNFDWIFVDLLKILSPETDFPSCEGNILISLQEIIDLFERNELNYEKFSFLKII